MTCQQFADKFPEFRSQLLSLTDRVTADGHLKSCQDCQTLVRAYDKTLALLASAKPRYLSEVPIAGIVEKLKVRLGL